jgi:hypothetical protein
MKSSKLSRFFLLTCLFFAFNGKSTNTFEPALVKVMTYSEIIGSEPFGGDVSINAFGKWIACSKQGVFVSTGTANTNWQQVFAPSADPMVNSNTSKILCRISDSGSWAVLSRAGLYRSSDSNILEGTLVNSGMGTNNVYDMDMRPNGNWIASASTGTWRFMNGAVAQVLSPASNANGASSGRRIVRINSNGDWIIMTINGVYENGLLALSNSGGVNVGGNINYWSLDFNENSDWVMINSRGTFLNAVRIVDPVIEVTDVGEMEVKLTDRNGEGQFTWVAISPRGIYINGIQQSVPVFLQNKTQYSIDINNYGSWIAAAEGGIILNGQLVTRTGTPMSIQTNNGIDNEVFCHINDFNDYVCLTNSGVFRNHRATVGAELAFSPTLYSPLSFKHVLRQSANGAVVALMEHINNTLNTGLYLGSNVLSPLPPQPVNAVLNGFTLSWSNSGGSTAGFRVSVSKPQAQAANSGGSTTTSCSDGSELYSGTNETFTFTDFSNFEYGLNYITLCALNTSGAYSDPIVFEYKTAPFQILAQNLDFNAKTVTMTWNSLPGKSYTIQKSTNLQTWEDLEFVISPSPSAAAIIAEPDQWIMTRTASDPLMGTPQQPRAFYRVKSYP